MNAESFEPKPISGDSIESALKKAEHYRLLNDPKEAESICRDVLRIDADNQQAIINYVLALTDQFVDGLSPRFEKALELVTKLNAEYDIAYYSGIISERRAKVHAGQRNPGSGSMAYHWVRKAMDWYEKAEGLSPSGNNSAILRWNTCCRLINDNASIRPASDESGPHPLLDV